MRVLAVLAVLLAALPARAQPIEVDVELVLMVDVSLSMSSAELELQRRGYAEALASEEVIAAIQGGLLGRVAVSYVEWAGSAAQRRVVDWRLLESREDALDFADALDSNFPIGMRRTSISGAIAMGRRMIAANGFRGLRRVIDLSGDGPNNEGAPVTSARDAALAAGLIVNGLPLMTRDGPYSEYTLDDLDLYYRACVIGGPGSFVLPVHDWSAFAEAVKRKLILELVGRLPPPGILPAQYAAPPKVDCLIGEKIWRQRWGGPGRP